MDYRQPDLSVITVNYNGFHDTCEFIDSWTATVFSVSYEMIVIDNGSTANEAALLQKTYPFIQAVRSEQNLGFAGGNNLGINLAKGKYLFLLNNDVCMVKDTIPLLIKRLLSSDKIAGVSPLIRDYAEPHAIQFAGYTQLSPITLRNRAIGKGKINKGHYPAQKTPYLHGAAMLLKKTIIDKLSLMPEEYFLYYEELDWCTYINREGYELWYDPACEIWHKDSSSTGKESPLKYYYLSRNRLLYAYRNLFDWKLPVSILYQTMIVCPKNILTALGKGKKTIAKAHWEGTKAFFKLRNKDKQP
jgi:GT2 family glycosyltransferase